MKATQTFSRLALLTSVLVAASAARAAAMKVEFNRDVRPILADNCLNCHGGDSGARKAKLRLDDRDSALLGGKSGLPALVPGKPGESELVLRALAPHDSEEAMPPLDSKKPPLKPKEIALLQQWIAQGAEYQPHWAFIPPTRPPLAATANSPVNAIDTLVAAQRERAGLVAAPPADPSTLCRRVYLDLVGLPPSPAELDEFLAAHAKQGPVAYHALVEKLLCSPHFGEKWARHWLDVARYADSDGYEKDLPRQQWAWRDWVINALNQDKQFIVEQVAGDLLANASGSLRDRQALTVATGYLRNSMVSEEGAILAEQYRKEAMFDRVDAIGKGVLGLTLQCAQCHTHKFDPVTHDDYFRTFANLDNTYEATSRIYGPEKLAVIERLQAGMAEIGARVKASEPAWPKRLATWCDEQRATATKWNVLVPLDANWPSGQVHPDVLADGSIITLGFRPTDGELLVTGTPGLARVTGLRIEALTHPDLIFNGPGRSIDGLFAVSELIVESQAGAEAKWQKLELAQASADFESPARPLGKPFRKGDDDNRTLGPAAFLIDGKVETAWSPDRGTGRRNAPTEIVVQLKEPLEVVAGTKLRATLRFKHGGKDSHGRENLHLGRLRLALTDTACPTASKLPTKARSALEAKNPTPAQRDAFFEAWRESVPTFAAANAELAALWAQFPVEDTTILHVAERNPEDTRETFRLDRGAWDQPREKISAGVPGFLPALAPGNEVPRLAFARWLVDRRSPTTARVAVNRAWQVLFGMGLVESPEDFGVRTAEPVQRELLDWLAVEFMERGWSQKELVRSIVSSATYQQSSNVTPALLENDPKNRLLARGPRFRADAEVIRDIALSASGLINDQLGGPSIFPTLPESFFASSFSVVDFWKPAVGADRYRRSLYVFRRRGMPDPVLSSFDAPTGETSCVRRERSNTPLAALASLNEPLFVEAAQALALRILREGGPADAARVAYAYKLCASRPAKAAEQAEILALLQSRRARLRDGWLSARTIAFGENATMPALPAGVTPNDVAAWTIAARVLLNLDETLTKN